MQRRTTAADREDNHFVAQAWTAHTRLCPQPMISLRYVWLAWSVLLLCVWAMLFATYPRHRAGMWWSSILALPFGCSEPFFLSSYWHPPSLLDLAATIHADVETFLFCFSIGGTAAVAYHVVTGRPPIAWNGRLPLGRGLFWYCAACLAPLPAFIVVIFTTHEIFWAGIAGFAAGTVARFAVRRDLAAKTLIGGLVFTVYYAAVLLAVLSIVPGYADLVWSAGPARSRIGPLPLTEVLFGAAFGFYWSGLLEQIALVVPLPDSVRRTPAATE